MQLTSVGLWYPRNPLQTTPNYINLFWVRIWNDLVHVWVDQFIQNFRTQCKLVLFGVYSAPFKKKKTKTQNPRGSLAIIFQRPSSVFEQSKVWSGFAHKCCFHDQNWLKLQQSCFLGALN